MKLARRIISIAFFAIIAFCICFSAGAIDEIGYCGENAMYAYNGNTKKVFITGEGAIYNYTDYTESPFFESDIKSVELESGVTGIGDYAFYCCESLIEVIIPQGVTYIGTNAFSCCGFSAITLPSSLEYIGFGAFSYCENLTDIYFCGTEEQWQEIEKGTNFADLSSIDLHFVCVHTNKSQYNQQNATCTVDGYTEGVYCPDCETWLEGHEVITANGHTDEDADYFCDTCTEKLPKVKVTGECGESATYELYDNGMLIISGSGEISSHVATDYADDITDVIIKHGITCIGDHAFSWRDNLKSVTIPNSVTSIEEYAFAGCSNLTGVIIPESVISIGDEAFRNCESLVEFIIPDGVSSIGYRMFLECTNLTSVTIPDSVTSIGDFAFRSCENLVSISIPYGVTSIGEYAFAECTKLADISISDSVSYISSSVFWRTAYYENSSNWENGVLYIGKHLIKVSKDASGFFEIKEGTVTVAGSAFYDCDKITNIVIPDTIVSLGDRTFCGCINITNITIPDSVTCIGDSAFHECTSFKSITIPDSVTSIGGSAFSGCTGLVNITLPQNITDIKICTFSDCSSLENIVIPENVETIDERAFHNCTALNSIQIPDRVTYINNRAFENCTALNNIILSTDNIYIDRDAFNNTAYYNNAYNWENGVLYIGNHLIEAKKDISGVCNIKNGTVDIATAAFEFCNNLTNVNIPNGLVSIGAVAFSDCINLDNVIIPDSVTSLGAWMFYDCHNLTNVTIPYGITSIGENMFADCEKLNNIIIPDSVSSIDKRAFYCCTSLKSVTIPYGVTSIGQYAFAGCANLKYIVIPNSVTRLDEYIFIGCIGLSDIFFTGDKSEWDNVAPKDLLSQIKVHYNYVPNTVHYTSKETQPVSCKQEGIITYECPCGYLYTETIPKLPHEEEMLYGRGATCTEKGLTDGKKCIVCNTVTVKQEATPALGHTGGKVTCAEKAICIRCGQSYGSLKAHTYKTTTTKATLSKNGKTQSKCSACGEVKSTTTVYYPKTITLSATEYAYNSKVNSPAVTVKDSKGNTLKKDTDYTVKYESGCKLPGKYTVTITFKGKYEGSKKLTFTIKPKVTSKVTATQTITTITLKWSKVTGADGYRVYKYNSKTKKYEYFKSTSGTSLKITDLKAGTDYKFKVRAYKKDGDTIYGAYSDVLATATKTKTPSITSIYSKTKGKAVVKWSNVTGESGYQLYYATSKDGTYKKVKSYEVNKLAGSKTKLKSGKKYYFKVRAYKKTSSGTVYSSWSAVKSVKIK